MRKTMSSLFLAAALLALPAAATARDSGAVELQKMLAGRSAEAPVSCLDLHFVTNTTVIEGTAIVYRVANRLFVNAPADPSRIRRDDILVTRSVGSQLCENDTVTLLDWGSRIQHGYVLLGKFVPYSQPRNVN